MRRRIGAPGPAVQIMEPGGHARRHVPPHDAVGRELAAGDRDQSGRAFDDTVLARDGRRRQIPSGGEQGTQSRPGRDDVRRRQAGLGEAGVRRAQQIVHVLGAGPHSVGGHVLVGVGRSDVALLSPGQYEHHPAVDRRGEGHGVGVAHALPRHDHMRTLGEPQQRLGPGIVEASHAVEPRSRRVHDHQGAHGAGRAAQRVPQGGAADPAIGLQQARHFRVVGDQRARLRGAPHRREDEARVVRLRVVVEPGALQVPLAQPGLEAQHGLPSEPTVRPHVAEGCEQVVQPQARPELPRGHARASIRREEKRQRPDEVRGDREQHAPLAARLEHQAERPLLQVAQPAVDQARGVRRGPAAEVALVHERRADTAQRRIAGDTGARDAAADHQQVHRLRDHRQQRRGPALVRELRFGRHSASWPPRGTRGRFRRCWKPRWCPSGQCLPSARFSV